jgi:Ca2+-binding RTX toxin-like protein
LTSTTGVSDNLKGSVAGGDTFVFAPNFGNDTISNYTPGQDVIAIDHTIFASASAAVAAATDVGGNAVIHVDANDSIILTGISVATLTQHQNDFHIV